MMTQVAVPAQRRASVLIVTLFMTSLIGFFLYSYLYLARTQRTLVTRSQAWNHALTAAEAGVEEALAQLNPGITAASGYPTKLITVDKTANGWGSPVNGLYGPMNRTLQNSSYGVVYTDEDFPTIYATGSVKVAYLSAALSRTVKVTTTNAALFSAALVGINGINFSGNGVNTDSFNSTNGIYNPTNANSNGDIASVFGIINVANGDVHGTVYLGPTATNQLGSNGEITGGVCNDFNVDFESVALPAGSATWLPPKAGTTIVGTNTFLYAFGETNQNAGGNYSLKGSLLNDKCLYVGSNTHVTLLITGDTSPAYIKVAGVGTNAGHLTVYMDGPTFTLNGTATVDSGNALNFEYYGTTNNTKILWNGNGTLVGTLYAPQAMLQMKGGGSTYWDFIGAAVVNYATVTGNWSFHFDENIALNGPKTGYIATSWQEL